MQNGKIDGEATAADGATAEGGDVAEVWRNCARAFGSVPKWLQEAANIDENGEAREGGISPMGRKLAEKMALWDKIAERVAGHLAEEGSDHECEPEFKVLEGEEAIEALQALAGSRKRRRAEAGGGPLSSDQIATAIRGWPAVLGGLGLIDPIRAAVAAAARALADGIDGEGGAGGNRAADGIPTGQGRDRWIGTARGSTLRVDLGREPFVLLRGEPAPGGIFLSVAVGGREMFDSYDPEQFLLAALEGIAEKRQRAEAEGGDVADYLHQGVYLSDDRQTGPRASDANVPVSPAPAGSGDTRPDVPAGGARSGDDGGASPDSNSPAPQPSDEGSGGASGSTAAG